MVMKELSHTVYFDFDEIEGSVVSNCVRSAVSTPAGAGAAGGDARAAEVEDGADRMLVQAEELSTEFDFRDMLHLSDEE